MQILIKVPKDTLSHVERVWLLSPDFFDHSSLCSKMREGKIQFPHHSLALDEQSFCLCFTVGLDRRLLFFRVRDKNGGGCK